MDLPRFRGRVRTWVSRTQRLLSPLVVEGCAPDTAVIEVRLLLFSRADAKAAGR